MAANFITLDDDQGYIDIIFSASSPPCTSSNTLPYRRTSIDFEFQKPFISIDTQTTLSPADDLFYEGKLLPLYDIPPRRQVVHSRLPNEQLKLVEEDLYYTITFATTDDHHDAANGSPADQYQSAPCPESIDCFLAWPSLAELGQMNSPSKKSTTMQSWMKRVKLIIGHKMKSSRAYLKCLLLKSAASCSAVSCYKTLTLNSRVPESSDDKTVVRKKTFSIPTMAAVEGITEGRGSVIHRRSLSMSRLSIQSPSTSSSSCSSSSGASSCSFRASYDCEVCFLSNEEEDDDDDDVSVDAAIAYCKNSRKILNSSLINE